MIRRLPIRLRVTLAFAGAMAVVLAATGGFLALRFTAGLDHAIDSGLRSRADGVRALVMQADTGLRDAGGRLLTPRGETFAQVLTAGGRVLDATPDVGRGPTLTPAEVRRARAATLLVGRRRLGPDATPYRLLAVPVRAQGLPLVVVVGASLRDRDGALSNLATLLLIGGPAALALASLAGYAVAGLALRPIEHMRRRAEELSVAQAGGRLPVPPAGDEVASLGTTLNRMLARNEAAFARERALIADASHELRTPLSVVRTEIDVALRGDGTQAGLRAALVSVGEETDQLAQLAEDLLTIARFDEDRLPLRRAAVPVAAALDRVAARFQRRAAEAGRTIEVAPAPGVSVLADETRLEQALANVVDNALRHGAGPVRISAAARDDRVEVHVRDGGDGFPDGFAGRAFERFARGDHARTTAGSGLGLAIVQVIARAHGGEAHIGPAAAGGADVWVTLPAAAGVPRARPPA